jgi:hypothetical protein
MNPRSGRRSTSRSRLSREHHFGSKVDRNESGPGIAQDCRIDVADNHLPSAPSKVENQTFSRFGHKPPVTTGFARAEDHLASFESNCTEPLLEAPHFTRSRNGSNKSGTMSNDNDTQDHEDIFKDMEICGALLASIDQRAYHRDLLQDANAILEEIVFPQCFPWTHPEEPVVKTIPHDIDEMSAVKKAGDDPTENHGAVERPGKRNRLAGNIRSMAFRAEDPGVVQVTSLSIPSRCQRESLALGRRKFYVESIDGARGELSLLAFEETRDRKRQRREIEVARKKATSISVRFGSTSSRSTIFGRGSTVKGQAPLLLPAVLPVEIHDGKRVSAAQARLASSALGVYDSRHGLLPSNAPRVVTGRNRLFWSVKEGPTTRSTFRSLLTGLKYENGTQKRPRRVKVGIRVNSSLLSLTNGEIDSCTEKLSQWTAGSESLPVKYRTPKPNQAVDTVLTDSKPNMDHSMCSIDFEYLVAELAKNLRPRTSPISINKRSMLQPRRHSLGISVPPVIECVPTEDGLLRTICIMPGKLTSTKDEVPPTLELEEAAKAIESNLLCRVCWIDGIDGQMQSCARCQMCIHRTCCRTPEDPTRPQSWTCDSCRHLSENTDDADLLETKDFQSFASQRTCHRCSQKGGSFAYQDGYWVHDTCLVWGGAWKGANTVGVHRSGVCALCSHSSSYLVKCAAKGCLVQFHPSCAAVTSAVSRRHYEASTARAKPDPLERDTFLCTQYHLDMLCVVLGSGYTDRILPVAFCGYHHPQRRVDWKGLPPGAMRVNAAIRVPPHRSYNVSVAAVNEK